MSTFAISRATKGALLPERLRSVPGALLAASHVAGRCPHATTEVRAALETLRVGDRLKLAGCDPAETYSIEREA